MSKTHLKSDTRIDEIADGIYRISTPAPPAVVPGGFTFNQYLIVDDQPLLFHTGLRSMFPLVKEAIATVMPVEHLSFIGFSHYEADESGALNEFLSVSGRAVPLCGQIAALVTINDVANRPARAMVEGELLSLGRHKVRWFDTPHLPHSWECGYLMEETTKTLLCGDLFTQGGSDHPALIESDILGPSESFRNKMDYYSHTKNPESMIEKLASAHPTTLACMHGSAWHGDGADLLRALGRSLVL